VDLDEKRGKRKLKRETNKKKRREDLSLPKEVEKKENSEISIAELWGRWTGIDYLQRLPRGGDLMDNKALHALDGKNITPKGGERFSEEHASLSRYGNREGLFSGCSQWSEQQG